MFETEYIISPCSEPAPLPPMMNGNTQNPTFKKALRTFPIWWFRVFLAGLSVSLNKNRICPVCNWVSRNAWHLKMVAISHQTLSVLISKAEIIMDASQGLGEDQIRSYMSESFVNTVYLLATQNVHESAAAAALGSWLEISILGSTPGFTHLLIQNLHINEIPRWFVYTVKFEKEFLIPSELQTDASMEYTPFVNLQVVVLLTQEIFPDQMRKCEVNWLSIMETVGFQSLPLGACCRSDRGQIASPL